MGNEERRDAECREESEQPSQKEAEQLRKVHGGGAEQGVELVTQRAFQAVAFQTVVALEVSDARFDRSPPLHPSPDSLWDRAASPEVHQHLRRLRVVVAPVAHIHMDRLQVLFFDIEPLHLLHLRLQRLHRFSQFAYVKCTVSGKTTGLRP